MVYHCRIRKERRDDDSDDDGEFDPTYESLPANKSTYPPMYKQAPYYNGGGDDSGLPSYNPPPQAGGDTTSLPLDGVLGPPAFAYPPPIDINAKYEAIRMLNKILLMDY